MCLIYKRYMLVLKNATAERLKFCNDKKDVRNYNISYTIEEEEIQD